MGTVKDQTIGTLKKICNGILSNPTSLKVRNLSLMSLLKKFHCQTPIQLLTEYGFAQSMDLYNPKPMRLRYDSSDLTPIKSMQSILEKGERMNIQISDFASLGNGKSVAVDAEKLRMLMAMKALTQQQNDSFDIGKALGLNVGDDDDEKNGLMDNDPMQMLMKTMNQLNNASNGNNLFDDDFKSTNLVESDDDDDDDEEQMHYIQIKRVLSRIKLGKYAANFINNGIKTMQQMMEIDPSFIPLLIENQKDQNKFVEFIKKR